MLCHTEDGEFYLLVKGYELKTLPDVPIVCPPLLNTSTHKLALETNPVWCLRVRHKGHWRTKTRPKVRVYPDGNGQCPAISFHLPAQARFESPDSVFAALAKAEYTLNLHDLKPAVHKRTIELAELEKARAAGYQQGKEDGRWESSFDPAYKSEGVVERSVFDLLAEWNAKTEVELKARRPKPTTTLPTAEVIDITSFLKERGVAIDTETDNEVLRQAI